MLNDKKKIIIPLAVVLILFGIFLYKQRAKHDKWFSGVVEATTYDLSFEYPGKLEKIHFVEGDHVKKGQLLAGLDEDTFKAGLQQAEANLETATAQLSDLIAGARPQEIRQAEAQLTDAKAFLEQLENGPTSHQLNQAKALMESARENYLQMKNGYRKEDVGSAGSGFQSARSSLDVAERNFARYKNLYEEGSISAREYDGWKNSLDVARANYNIALENYRKMRKGPRDEETGAVYQQYMSGLAHYEDLKSGTRYEQLKQARSKVKYWENQVDLLLEGPRVDQVKAQRKRVEEAGAVLEQARIKLKDSKIYSPSDGVIISKNFEELEMIPAGAPAITMADLRKPWVYVFVPETDVGKVSLGAQARITVDSYPKEVFNGRVVRIYEKTEYTPKYIQTRRERVNLVFRVKVEVENPELILKPGMPADVEILKDGKSI